jgi:hypothetical protein
LAAKREKSAISEFQKIKSPVYFDEEENFAKSNHRATETFIGRDLHQFKLQYTISIKK